MTAPAGADWHDACADEDLWEDDMLAVTVAGRDVLLVRSARGVCAFANVCPHKGTPLDQGALARGVLTCGNHNWSFDADTGAGVNPRRAQLECFAARVEGGRIQVGFPAPAVVPPGPG